MDPLRKDIDNEILELLKSGAGDDALFAGVADLETRFGTGIYKEVLLLLTGKNFGTERSRLFWAAAVDHRKELLAPPHRDGGFRTALFDYLYRNSGELSDPRFVDAEFLDNINRSSITDGLTGLYHQSYFKKFLEHAIAGGRRDADHAFAVILFDLDHFKQYNDRCGHLCGDEALRRTAEIIRESLRDGDLAARYGGEEFAVYLPGVSEQAAHAVAERIRGAIEAEAFPHEKMLDRKRLTISGGVALYPRDATTMLSLVDAADKQLYKAKGIRNAIFPSGQDRRRSTRRPIRSLVEFASFEGALFRPALSHDLSPYGMKLGCETLITPDTVLSLRLTRPFWPENVTISATVRHVHRQGSLVYVGLEFAEPLNDIDHLIPEALRRPQNEGAHPLSPPPSANDTPLLS